MFGFLFGNKNEKKFGLIKKLIRIRMTEAGFDKDYTNKEIESLSRFRLMGTPEGTIVTILDTVTQSQKRGALLAHILPHMEKTRRLSGGSDLNKMNQIVQLAFDANKAGSSVPAYCIYRVGLEYPNTPIKSEQIHKAIILAMEDIVSW